MRSTKSFKRTFGIFLAGAVVAVLALAASGQSAQSFQGNDLNALPGCANQCHVNGGFEINRATGVRSPLGGVMPVAPAPSNTVCSTRNKCGPAFCQMVKTCCDANTGTCDNTNVGPPTSATNNPAPTSPPPVVLPPPAAMLPPAAMPPQLGSLWGHNGSVMSLVADGPKRRFYYAAPREGLQSYGVSNGSLLFEGIKNGDSYSGTAFIFSKACGPMPYEVSGPVSADSRSVTLYGKAPRLNSACQIIAYRDDVLEFNFRETVGN